MYFHLLDERLVFPPVEQADSSGLLAIGGDLSVERLLLAYSKGIFPWFSEHYPIMWYAPDPRFVLFPQDLKVAKSLRQVLKKEPYTITFDQNFRQVITHCQQVQRPGQDGTWITEDMCEAYCSLHKAGWAHSVEVWQGEQLVGGLYGVFFGKIFCGESMFALAPNASKIGFVKLVEKLLEKGVQVIDCQVYTDHLSSFGAQQISRQAYMGLIEQHGQLLPCPNWKQWLAS